MSSTLTECNIAKNDAAVLFCSGRRLSEYAVTVAGKTAQLPIIQFQ
jgi:hypothetical protein